MAKKIFDLELFKKDQAKQYNKRLYIGNGNYAIFTSLQDLKKFSADTRRYFWAITTEINQLYIEIFSLYRETWFISATTRKINYDGNMETIANHLTCAVAWLEKLARRLRQANEPSYIALNGVQCVTNFIYATQEIQKIFTRAQENSRSKVCATYIDRLNDLKTKIELYGGN